MKYKDALTREMETLAKNPRTLFLGYNTQFGPRMGKTLTDVPKEKIWETPLDESIMMGAAIGMAITGEYLPVVCVERFNFIWNMSDQIVNHLDKIAKLSRGEFNPHLIIRVTVGNEKTGMHPGPQHVGDYSDAFRLAVSFPIMTLRSVKGIARGYEFARNTPSPIMLVEYRDLYDIDETVEEDSLITAALIPKNGVGRNPSLKPIKKSYSSQVHRCSDELQKRILEDNARNADC